MTDELDLTEASLTFPHLPEPQITRDQLVTWLRDRFALERKVIVVQGRDGAGKTTLLAQFAKAWPDRCFSFFVGADPWASSLRQFLLEMCTQMHKVVGSKQREVNDDLSENELKQLFSTFYRRAAKKTRAKGHRFYFVVDGLEWVAEGYGEQNILDFLPTALPDGIYLLASSAPDQQFRFTYDPWSIPFFSSTETTVYLADIDLEKEQVMRIYQACQGMPGYLAQIRREIESGQSIDDVLTNLPKGFRRLLEREWERSRIDMAHVLDALAVLAYTETPLDLERLAAVIDAKPEELETSLTSVPFVQLDPEDGPIHFVTDAHKRFVVDTSRPRRGQAEAMLIQYCEQDPFSDSALIQLPVLYKKTGRYDALRRLVDMDYLTRTLQQQQDVSLLRRNARLMADEAYKAQDWQTLFKYSMVGSILRTVSTRSAIETEVEARLALGDYQQSFEMAYQAALPEDRLQLLARVGRHLKRHEILVPAGVLSDLEHIVADIRPTGALRERVVQIAADLFYIHPQAALELIEKVIGTDTQGQSMDIILAVLTLRLKDEPDSAEMLKSRIRDQSLRDFVRVSSPLVAELSPEQVLSEASEIDDTSGRLFLLRSWCNANRDNPEAISVIHEALEIMTTSTDYSPSMRHLRQFAEPLIGCAGDEVYRAVERLDLLKDTAIGEPADERTRLELLLASIEARQSRDKATSRLYQAYFELDGIPELDIRCYCLARILLSLPNIDPTDHRLEKEVVERLIKEYGTLLEGSARHLVLTRRLLRALTKYKPDMALEFASKLNMRHRRDMACSEILRACTDQEPEDIDLGFADDVLARISEAERRDWTLVRILERFARKDMFARVPEARRFVDKIADMREPRDQSYAYAYCSQMMASAGKSNAARRLIGRVVEAWSTIDQKWEKVRIGFELVAIIAEYTPEEATDLLEQTIEERATTPLAEEMFAELYIGTVKLAIRTFSDTLKGQEYLAQLERLIEVIRRIPSCAVQSELLAALAMRTYLAGKQHDFEQLVKEGVLKALETCEDAEARAQTVVRIAPCLFRYERSLMTEEILQLSSSRQDEALGEVMAHLLSGRPPDDPVDLDSLNVETEYVDAIRACAVVEQMNNDSAIHSYLYGLVDALVQRDPQRPEREGCNLLERQVLTIAQELGKIARTRLPDANNIQHDGYKISAQACIARLRESTAQRSPLRATERWKEVAPSWPEIAARAQEVPNLADRALVMAWAGQAMYRSHSQLGAKMLQEAKDCIYTVPDIIDRADRLRSLAQAWKHADDKESAKFLLKEAMSILEAWTWDHTRDRVTGSILKLAHALDPEFAASLTSYVDNPVIEGNLRQDLAARELQRQPDKITSQEPDIGEIGRVLSQAAWRLLRSFCSGKGYAQREEVVGQWVHMATNAEFDDAYKVLAWSIENNLARTKDVSASTLSDTYYGLLDLLELIYRVGETLLSVEERAKAAPGKTPALPAALELFPVGAGPQGTLFLQKWLVENARSYVKLYDPYFTAAELEVLKHISPDTRVDVVTSWKAQEVSPGDPAIEARYRDAWDRMSDQTPPETHIHIVGIRSSGESPMHDRYVVTQKAGLQLGTSLSGLGRKDTYIRPLDADQASGIEQRVIDPLLLGHQRQYQGENLTVRTFTL